MAGGIQPGTVATDEHARKLDKAVKNISKSLINEMKDLGYEYKSKLDHTDIVTIGCEPDGALWFKDGVLVAVFEAKKQGAGGNAIERWAKNVMLCYALNRNVRYVTFGAREGFAEGNYCYKFGQTMMNTEKALGFTDIDKSFNILYPSGQSWFANVDAFTDEFIIDIMRKAITGNLE